MNIVQGGGAVKALQHPSLPGAMVIDTTPPYSMLLMQIEGEELLFHFNKNRLGVSLQQDL